MVDSLRPIFAELRERLLRASRGMDLAQDDPGNVILKTPWIEPGRNEPAWFCAIQLKKNYVSLHLMPLYALPSLRNGVSPELQKRMQGKSCFNFKMVEIELFDALERLAAECATAYATPVTVQPH